SVAENLILGQQHRYVRGARLDDERIAANARRQIETFDIRPADPALPARARRRRGGDRVHPRTPPRGARRRQGDPSRVGRPRRGARPVRPHRRDVRWQDRRRAAARERQRRDSRPLHDRRGGASGRVKDLREGFLPALVALLIAALVGDVLIVSFGQNPATVYRLLLEGTWGNAYGLGQVLYKTTTLAFTGLSVAVGLRAGLFNIGGESQLAAGGFVAALVGLLLPAGVPALAALPLFIVAAAAGGAVVGGIPGVLKAKFGAHEVITTIMLNFIVLALLNY